MPELLPHKHCTSQPSPEDRPVWVPPRLGVCVAEPDAQLHEPATRLAAELELPLVTKECSGLDLLLVVGKAGLELCVPGSGGPGPLRIGFIGAGGVRHRLATATRRQPLALAVGLKRRKPTVVDATAGLGRDAMLLASLGCVVTAVERSPVLGVLLRDALEQATAEPELKLIIRDRVKLVIADAREVLEQMADSSPPDVVYLDPMFEPRKKTALPKKEMRILRRLVGDDRDADKLFEVARRVARERVVVKRTPHAPPPAPTPDLSYAGKIARYDVYLP